MSELSFDSNIVIDAMNGIDAGRIEIRRATRPWISRVTWIEAMSKDVGPKLVMVERFLGGFSIDEVDAEVARRAAALRRARPSLKLLDATILASAQVRGRILVTRNIKDFPATMPGIRVPYTI